MVFSILQKPNILLLQGELSAQPKEKLKFGEELMLDCHATCFWTNQNGLVVGFEVWI